ncbi:MAG: inositol monophosphatase [Alphaproteobacteria bacterium PRO2]|nr:inositol monophosphatase [Alphaproteobacteria bacterium PRO2]
MSADTQKVSGVIIECAEKYILPRYKALAQHEISAKTSPRDLVTQADLDVEEHLTRVLPGLLPGSIVIGEEAASKNPALLDQLDDKSLKIWIVDPVDGTHNFVHSKREFGVMLALIENGEARQGWIYDVLGKEMTVAERGGGAFAGSRKLNVNAQNAAAKMSGHINPWFFPKQYREYIQQSVKKFGSTFSMACAAHEYLRVAKGEAQFCIYSRLKPWDHVAGTLIVEEAGGYAAKWDGARYTPQDRDKGLIVAAGEKDWREVYDVLLKDVL